MWSSEKVLVFHTMLVPDAESWLQVLYPPLTAFFFHRAIPLSQFAYKKTTYPNKGSRTKKTIHPPIINFYFASGIYINEMLTNENFTIHLHMLFLYLHTSPQVYKVILPSNTGLRRFITPYLKGLKCFHIWILSIWARHMYSSTLQSRVLSVATGPTISTNWSTGNTNSLPSAL